MLPAWHQGSHVPNLYPVCFNLVSFADNDAVSVAGRQSSLPCLAETLPNAFPVSAPLKLLFSEFLDVLMIFLDSILK